MKHEMKSGVPSHPEFGRAWEHHNKLMKQK